MLEDYRASVDVMANLCFATKISELTSKANTAEEAKLSLVLAPKAYGHEITVREFAEILLDEEVELSHKLQVLTDSIQVTSQQQ